MLASVLPISKDEAMNALRPVMAVEGFSDEALWSDPSTIFLSLKITPPGKIIPVPDRGESYARFLPEQRYVYLDWLQDVSQPAHENYVLLYYLGLERFLLYGDFDSAYDELLYLRKCHVAPQMRSRSFLALLWACEKRNYLDRIPLLLSHYDDHYYGVNVLLSFMWFLRLPLTVEMLFNLRPRFTAKVNTRYIHSRPNLYLDSLESVLSERFGRPEIRLRDILDISTVSQIEERAFGNPSIPREDRFVVYYDFRHDAVLNGLLEEIYAAAHEKTKLHLRKERYGVSA